MTDSTNNFNDSPRECLEYYATMRPDSIMGYRPSIENELTCHFVALGALEWKALDGVKYCKTTPDGRRMLEEYRHGDTQAKLDAANARITELEAVIVEVVGAFEVVSTEHDSVSFSIPYISGFRTIYREFEEGDGYSEIVNALRRLLDTLPPSE